MQSVILRRVIGKSVREIKVNAEIRYIGRAGPVGYIFSAGRNQYGIAFGYGKGDILRRKFRLKVKRLRKTGGDTRCNHNGETECIPILLHKNYPIKAE